MEKYLSQIELIKKIESNLNKLESGQMSIQEIEMYVSLVRELYERSIVLRYKAFEHITSVEVTSPLTEEVSPLLEAQEGRVEEEQSVEIHKEEFLEETVDTDESEANTHVEFDIFNASEQIETVQTTEVEQEPILEAKTDHVEEVDLPLFEAETPVESIVEPTVVSTSNFSTKVFEINQKTKNQIGITTIPSLVGSFGLNERLMYINELFDGSSESFSDTIKQLDSRSNLSEAAQYIDEIATNFKWEEDSDTVEEFIQKLCRRFD